MRVCPERFQCGKPLVAYVPVELEALWVLTASGLLIRERLLVITARIAPPAVAPPGLRQEILVDGVGRRPRRCPVAGSRGSGGFVGMLLGSVGHQYVDRARCPVVPGPARVMVCWSISPS
jgi:hypothetical protein